MEPTTPSTATASPSGLSQLSSGGLSLLLATPTQTQTQVKTPRLMKKTSIRIIDDKLTPIIPQKRRKVVEEREEFEFRAGPSFSSITRPSLAKSRVSTPTNSALDIRMIIQNAISPLITEIKELKEEIRQLKTNSAKASSVRALGPKEAPKPAQRPISTPVLPKKTLATATSKNIANPTLQPPAKKLTYAGILSEGPQAPETSSAPWTLVKKKSTTLAQELTPKKATEPCQRRIIFQRQKDAPKNANLPNLLLALNKAMKQWGLPDHIRLLKLGYTGTGAISGLLGEKATASMIIPMYSDALIKIAIQDDTNITGIDQAEQWYRLRVHRVLLNRYFNSENGLNVAKEEIEATQGLSMPLMPQWLAKKEDIRKRYDNEEIKFSTIVITVRNKLEADKLMAKGLHFGGFNHTVDRYWETGPEEICPRCLEYGHSSYRGCSKAPRCYICAGDHEATEHKCPITGCSTLPGKACIHLPVKCIHCKGPHQATSIYCPKRKAAIEEAKKKKQAAKDLAVSRKRIQVVIPVRIRQETLHSHDTPNSSMDQDIELTDVDKEASNQIEAQLQQAC